MSSVGSRVTTIPVGTFYTGAFDYLVLVMDDDAGAGADSRFSNVVIRETLLRCWT